jgi:hypothetical protein
LDPRAKRYRQTGVMLGVGLALTAAGVVWAAWPSQAADRSFVPIVAEPAYTGRPRPAILIDGAHYNIHTASGSYRPFAELLRRDGYRVRGLNDPLSSPALRDASVVVISNALGFKGVLQHTLNLARLERFLRLPASPFSDDEISEVEAWVRRGGALLLVADHAPAGEAAGRLARAFGVEMTNMWAEDENHHDPVTDSPGFVVFTRDEDLVADHPITNGRHAGERIGRVMTFTGQALRPPPGAMSLLTLSATARQYPYRRSRESEGRSAAGLSQAIALRHGRGRVIIVGEAAMLTAQTTRLPDGTLLRFGMSRDDTDNRQFVLNLIHWLSRLLDPE